MFDIFPPSQWWMNEPDRLIQHVYWMKSRVPPTASKPRTAAYRSLVESLNRKHPAPADSLKYHMEVIL